MRKVALFCLLTSALSSSFLTKEDTQDTELWKINFGELAKDGFKTFQNFKKGERLRLNENEIFKLALCALTISRFHPFAGIINPDEIDAWRFLGPAHQKFPLSAADFELHRS